jgi:hypothetical protein
LEPKTDLAFKPIATATTANWSDCKRRKEGKNKHKSEYTQRTPTNCMISFQSFIFT